MVDMNRRKPKNNPVVINVDADLFNSDWSKISWDLPAYKSPEFMRFMNATGQSLEKFRALPVYRHAVASGLINGDTDEWMGDDDDAVSTTRARNQRTRGNS